MVMERSSLRAVQACQNCRAQKGRCTPSTRPGTCERCLRLKKQCHPHIPKAHSERGVNSARKALSKDSVRAAGSPVTSTDAGVIEEHDVYTSTERRSVSRSSPRSTARISSPLPSVGISQWARASLGARMLETFDPGASILNKMQAAAIRRIYEGTAESLLSKFRLMQEQFPFVILSQDVTCAELAHSKPFLTLGILLTASIGDEEFQNACDLLFRSALATKAIVKGERSLELLQGLLIYLAWHHHYMNRETQQLYQYIQLAIGMAIDLGPYKQLLRNVSNERVAREFKDITTIETHHTRSSDAQRAILGCYHISCGGSLFGFDKPQNLRFDTRLQAFADQLVTDGEHSSDKSLKAIMDIWLIADDVRRVLRNRAEESKLHENARLQMDLHYFEVRLQEWSATNEADCPAMVISTWLYTHVYLYESAFHISPGSPMQTSMLLSCYEACKTFLDHFLEHAIGTLAQATIVQWSCLTNTIILMVKLSRSLPTVKAWDPKPVREIAKAETYADRICDAIATHADIVGSPKPETLFLWLRLMGEGMRKWLARGGVVLEGQSSTEQTAPSSGPGNQPGQFMPADVTSIMQSLSTPAVDFSIDGMMEDVSFDDGFWGGFNWDAPGQ